MGRITIYFEDNLVGAVKHRAALRRQSVSGYISLLIARDLGLPTYEGTFGLPSPATPLQAVAEEQAAYHAGPPPVAGKGAGKHLPHPTRG